MLIRFANFSEHKKIVQVSKQSKFTRDFTNQIFSGEEMYLRSWITIAEHREILGFYCVRHKIKEPVTSLYFIGVDRNQKGIGVGFKLLEHMKVNSPHKVIELNCIKENEEALIFYDRNGFKIIGEGLKGLGWRLRWKGKNDNSN